MSIGKTGAKLNISSNGSVPPSDIDEVPDSEPDTDDEDKDDGDEYGEDEDDSQIKVRRSTRSTKLPRQNLPFSPKKTRSQKIIVLDSDEGDDDADGSATVPTRRSTRSRKAFKVKLDEGAYYESEQEDDSEGYDPAPKLKKPTKAARKKGARPAYGHVRVVADLDYDPNSDEETAPLRAHRAFCEKCHEEPAHVQLETVQKRPKGKGRKKRKTSDDDLEESGDEVELITKRGGWVRWLV